MYNWLKRKGYDQKYERAGIYCIKVDDRIVYIGKSHNMLKRVAAHYAAIKGETVTDVAINGTWYDTTNIDELIASNIVYEGSVWFSRNGTDVCRCRFSFLAI